MGHEIINRVTLGNGEVSVETISERDLGENEDYFDNGRPLPGTYVVDTSYLN